MLSQSSGQVAYALLTRSPLTSKVQAPYPFVRLACIKHAASVHPEPGSNSPFEMTLFFIIGLYINLKYNLNELTFIV